MHESLEHELAHHAAALRRLAVRLVGPDGADDLVQDAALQTLVRPPANTKGLGAWLAAVLRHRASKHLRGERRRRTRELQQPVPATPYDPRHLAEQRETIARLHTGLLALPAVYADVLQLRYFEDLTPTEIATRIGAPLATVKSRLQRGLGLLREQLGDERDWRPRLCAAFGLNLGALPLAGATLATGAIMATAGKLWCGSAVAVAAIWWMFATLQAPTMAPDTQSHDASATPAVIASGDPDRANQEPSATSPAPNLRTAAATDVVTLRGHPVAKRTLRFVDVAQQPIAEVRLLPATAEPVLDQDSRALAVSDALGRTDISDATAEMEIVAWHPQFETQLLSLAAMPMVTEVVMQAGCPLSVFCVDRQGGPLANCLVQVAARPSGESLSLRTNRVGIANPTLLHGAYCARSDDRGVAQFVGLPCQPMFVRAVHDSSLPDCDYLTEQRELPAGVGQVTIRFARAQGVVATLPTGVVAQDWLFAPETSGVDRSVVGAAEELVDALHQRFPNCGAYVLRRKDAERDLVEIRATATDGSLWYGKSRTRDIAQLEAPTVLAPTDEPCGWLRVELEGVAGAMEGIHLDIVGQQMWRTRSGYNLQLPVGDYHVSLASLCPDVDEAIESRVSIRSGSLAEVQVLKRYVPSELGWLRLRIAGEVGVSVTLSLASGDGFTLTQKRTSYDLLLPAGRHQVRLGRWGFDPVELFASVPADGEAVVEVPALRRMRR